MSYFVVFISFLWKFVNMHLSAGFETRRDLYYNVVIMVKVLGIRNPFYTVRYRINTQAIMKISGHKLFLRKYIRTEQTEKIFLLNDDLTPDPGLYT